MLANGNAVEHVCDPTDITPIHIVHQPKNSGSRRFFDFLKRERKVQSHAGLGSSENSTFPHSGATLREAGLPLRHVIVGSDPQLPADVGDGRRLPIQAGRHHDETALQVTCDPFACEQPMSTSLTTPTTHLSCMLIAEPRAAPSHRSTHCVTPNFDTPLRSLGRSRKKSKVGHDRFLLLR